MESLKGFVPGCDVYTQIHMEKEAECAVEKSI